MAREFRLPDIGEGLTEATIVEWLVEVGEAVALDGPLVELETDKALTEIPAPIAGTLLARGGEEGEVLEVGDLLAVIGEAGETWVPASEPEPAQAAPIVGTIESDADRLEAPGSVEALPGVRRLARDLGVDLASLTGSGSGGRITEEDVRAAEATGPRRRVPLTRVRRAIAANLTRSWREIPHVTTYGEADAEPLLSRRSELGGPPLEALLIEAIVPVLKVFPAFNATFDEDAVVEHLRYDIGFAVDGPDGLMVAVLRAADTRGAAELAAEVRRLVTAVRERSATPVEMRGQTFTLSNIGAVGGRFGTPIIPFGTTAILSIGRAEPRPVVRGEVLAIATEFPLSLSYDHRVVDGASGRAFLAAVVASIESVAESAVSTQRSRARSRRLKS